MRYIKNYRDPVCDTCANGRWEKGGTCTCTKRNETVRERGRITDNFAACLGADYKLQKGN